MQISKQTGLLHMSDIKDYYIIGDLHSAALISKAASIDWLCLPHFDSPSIFAKLLDENAGSFSIERGNYCISSQYLMNTAIVEFTFQDKDQIFMVKDFMVPMQDVSCENHFLVREFQGIKGRSKVKLIFNPKPNYATEKSLIKLDNHLQVIVGQDIMLVYLPENSSVQQKKEQLEITFNISEGESLSLVMEYILAGHKPIFSKQKLKQQTIRFWQEWVSKGNYIQFCKEKLVRSAITLKLMQFYPTGAIVAAPTTSLPESISGVRNWDYRYVWIRDATFTLYALWVLGYLEEAEKFFEYIKKIVEKCQQWDFDVSLMYTISGDPVPQEKILNHISGYKNSQPVRIGNNASDQFQLDVYGALIDSYYFVSKRNIYVPKIHKNLIMNLVKKIAEYWQRQDNGIWEVRSKPKDFTYSKVMAWVGVNRTIRMSRQLGLKDAELQFCQNLEKQIYDWIWKNCYDPVNQTFSQHPQTSRQDATNLLFVLLQFLNKHDLLTRTIIKRTCNELSYKEVFVYRYFTDDGIKGQEGAFLLCTFWLISAWAILEDTQKASELFNKFTEYIAESGLLSEEINPDTGDYLGNFPQAFSHLGYIMSAYYLDRYLTKKHKLK